MLRYSSFVCLILRFAQKLSTPSHFVTAPVGHAASLRCAGTSTASVSFGHLADVPVRP